MAGRTTAQTAALEKKALAEPTKSAGMRMLLDAGYLVQDVAHVFDAPYGFVYGVATRANGGNPPAGAERRAPRAAKPAAKAARPAAKATKAAAAKAAPRAATKTASKAKATSRKAAASARKS